MLPYLLMFSLPAALVAAGARRARLALIIVAIFYWLMIGFRFQVGMDWNNYFYLYSLAADRPFLDLLLSQEPGSQLLMWAASHTPLGYIFVNIVSGGIFCWGFFKLARRFPEPFLAIIVATPLLVVAFAMSGTRQTIALGIIFYLFSTWETRSTLGRAAWILVASLFHFSGVFMLAFVALSSRWLEGARVMGALASGLIILLIIYAAPDMIQGYGELYVAGARRVEAPGAFWQVGVIALTALLYWVVRKRWIGVNGRHQLFEDLSIAALLAVPAVYVSSVGAYRFALYLWPTAMYVVSGLAELIDDPRTRILYRGAVVIVSALLMIGWLTFSNSGFAWLPYENWLLQSEGVRLRRS